MTKRGLTAALAVLFAVNAAVITLAQLVPDAGAESFKNGATGETVRKIQQRLSDWGYYSGAVDGIYGSATEAAVRKFQKKNGLTPDGVAGPATLAAIGLPSGSSGSASGSARWYTRMAHPVATPNIPRKMAARTRRNRQSRRAEPMS